MTKIDTWNQCYDMNWKGLICDAAFSHPAKFSRGLIFRIIEHALEDGLIQPGQTILDPFGGVGLGAIYAATCGLSWVGVELEEKFSTLARQNFIEWSERFWCTCGENGDSYLRSMRESVAKVGMGNEQDQEAQDGAVLQSGLPQQISLFGEEAFTGARRGAEGPQALEQGEVLESGNASNLIRESNGRQQGDGEKRQLEGREMDSEGWVYRDTGEREAQIGAPALNGDEPGTQVETGRNSTSQERKQARQSPGKFGSNDHIQAHGDTPPKWSGSENQTETVRDMRPSVSEQEGDYLQPGVQAAADSRILATARRQEEGAACPDCGKLIVPFPVILQGDSRRLAEVLKEDCEALMVRGAGLVVSSPPYAGAHITNITTGRIGDNPDSPWKQTNGDEYGSTPGQLGAMKNGDISAVISSPPFAGNSGGRGEASRNGIEPGLFDRHSGGMKGGTGDDPANLDHLPMGTPPSAIISSPPYADGCTHTGGNDPHPEHIQGGKRGAYGVAIVGSPPFADSVGSDDPDKRGGLFRDEKRRNDTNLTGTYGQTDGQLGGMKAGAVIGSPPFENSLESKDTNFQASVRPGRTIQCADYGSTAGQIGATQGQTFWEAARLIVEQCALLLPPEGAAIWVLKAYVKDGQIVDFPDQWQQLCEACGFETLHIHRAMLVKRRGSQGTMATGHDTTSTATNLLGKEVTTGGKALADKSLDVERYSFFRRLHIKKNPHLAIEWETVLCTRKAA